MTNRDEQILNPIYQTAQTPVPMHPTPTVPQGISNQSNGAMVKPDVFGGLNTLQGKNGTPTNVPTIDFGSILGLSTGGGGGASVNAAADAQNKLIEDRKAQLIEGINQRFGDEQAALGTDEQLIRDETNRQTGYVNTERDNALNSIRNNALAGKNEARRAFSDLQTELRRRTRATGAGSSSGFLEMANNLDTELQSNLTSINSQELGLTGNAQLVAEKALGDLQSTLQRAVADIEKDRRASRRDKDAAIQEAEFVAAQQAVDVQKWLSSRTSRGGSGQSMADQQRALGQQFAIMMNQASSGKFGSDTSKAQQQIAEQFFPAFIGTGGLDTFQNIGSFFQPAQDPFAPSSFQDQLALDKFMFDQQKYMNDNPNYGVQQEPAKKEGAVLTKPNTWWNFYQ